MGVIGSLSRGIGVLQRNPVIVALVFAFTVLGTASSAVQMVDQLLVYPTVLVFYLLMPFFLGGVIGLVYEALSGPTSVGRFFADAKSNYLSLFGGGLVLGVLTFLIYLFVGIFGFVLTVFVLGFGSMAGATTASIAFIGVGVVLALVFVLTPWFVLQFFPAAVVVDDLGLVDSFKRSGSIVRNNFLSVLGFDAIAFLFYLLAQVPTLYLFYTMYEATNGFQQNLGNLQETQGFYDLFSATELGIYFAMWLILGTAAFSVLQAYYVAYYDQLPR